MAHVIRGLGLSERTVRRWRRCAEPCPAARRGRPARSATREQRNAVYRFLKERGPATPLGAVRAAFPEMRRADLASLLRRYRRVTRRRAERRQSRLEWHRAGAVWAADFKERREPLEGRYGWILSIQDLGSRYQLAWQPLVEATATAVQALYARLFAEHGPPLVLKSDNGGQFKAEETKRFLAEYQVLPLYSPKRHPQYNGGVERANGQVTRYQEAIAEAQRRPAGPHGEDAEAARELANDLAHPHGWRGPTARQAWQDRTPLTPQERAAFQATVEEGRALARVHWNFTAEAPLTHYQAAAVDRRAVRDALITHDFLKIHPKRKRRGAATTKSAAACDLAARTLTADCGSDDVAAMTAATAAPASDSIETTAAIIMPSVSASTDRQHLLRAPVAARTLEPLPQQAAPLPAVAPRHAAKSDSNLFSAPVHAARGAGRITKVPPMVGGPPDLWQRLRSLVLTLFRGGPFLRQ